MHRKEAGDDQGYIAPIADQIRGCHGHAEWLGDDLDASIEDGAKSDRGHMIFVSRDRPVAASLFGECPNQPPGDI